MFKNILKLLFALLFISCSKADIDSLGAKLVDSGEATISLAPGQEASTTDLPIKFYLQLPSDFDSSNLSTSDITNSGTATNVIFQVSSLGDNLFEVRASSTDGFGTITPAINKPEKGIKVTSKNSVLFSPKVSSATRLKSFNKKFASEETKVEFVFEDQSKFIFSSGGALYSSSGDAFSNQKLLETYERPYSKVNFLESGGSVIFSRYDSDQGDHYLYSTDGTKDGTRLIAGPKIDSTNVSDFFDDKGGNLKNYITTNEFIYFAFGESWNVVKLLKLNRSDLSISSVITAPGCDNPSDIGFITELNQKILLSCSTDDSSTDYKIKALDIATDTFETLNVIDYDFYIRWSTNQNYKYSTNFMPLNDGRLLFIGKIGSKFNLLVTDGTDAGTSLYGDIPTSTNLNEYGLSKDETGKIYVHTATEMYILDENSESFSSLFQTGAGYNMHYVFHDPDYIYTHGRKSGEHFILSYRRSDQLISEGSITTSMTNNGIYVGQLGTSHFFKYDYYNGTMNSYKLIKMEGTNYEVVTLEDESSIPFYVKEFYLLNNSLYANASTNDLKLNLFKFNGSSFMGIEPGNLEFREVNNVFSFQNDLIFTADDNESFEELWRHNSLALTNEKMFQMGTNDYGVKASKFFKFGTDYYTAVDDNENGGEIWEVGVNSSDIIRVTDTYSSSKGLNTSCESTSSYIACVNDTWTSVWSFDPSSNSATEHSSGGFKVYSVEDHKGNFTPTISHGEKFYFNMYGHPMGESPTGLVSFDGTTFANAAGTTGHSFDYDIKIVPGDGDNIIATNYWRGALITDGTGTNAFSLYPDIGHRKYGLAYHNGYYYITGADSSYDYHMWITDGTSLGTRLLVDFKPSGQDESYGIIGPGVGNNFIYAADDTVNGHELWTTDGTPGGTNLLKDIIPGSGGLGWNNYHIAALSNYSVLELEVNSNQEVWVTDNTGAGTSRVLDGFTWSYGSYVSGDKVFFDTWTSPDNSCQLHVVDGSTGNLTSLITTTNETVDHRRCSRHFFDYGGKTYFLAHTPSAGIELWETDGTPSGTKISRETLSGPESLFSTKAHPYMQVIGSELLFWGYDTVNGVSIWKLTL